MAIIALALCCLSLPCSAQKTYAQEAQAQKPKPLAVDEKSTVEPGVVVKAVEAGRQGDKAGLKVGDVILGWSRGDASGKIESPFDFFQVVVEQRPRGIVQLRGFRNTHESVWSLRSGEWGIEARPVIHGPLLRTYDDSERLLNSGKSEAAARKWAGRSSTPDAPSWVATWAAFYEAGLFRWAQDWTESEYAYRKTLYISQGQNPFIKARALNSFGGLYSYKGETLKSLEQFEGAINALPSAERGTLVYAYYLNDLAMAWLGLDELEKSEKYYRAAWQIRNQLSPGSVEEAISLAGLAKIALEKGHLGMAEEYYTKALAAEMREGLIGCDTGCAVSYILDNLADIADQRGDYVGAEKYVLLALKAQNPIYYKVARAAMLGQLAEIEFEKGNAGAAQRYLTKALRIVNRISKSDINQVDVFINVGEVARDLGFLRLAERYLKEGTEKAPDLGITGVTHALLLSDLADVNVRLGRLSEAELIYQKAAQMVEASAPGTIYEADAFAGLGRIALARGQLSVACEYLGRALTSLELQAANLGALNTIRADYRAKHANYYRDYLEVLVRQHKTEEAFQVVERSRARTLLETLYAATVDIHQGADPELLKREHALQAEIKAKSDHRVRMLTQEHTPEQMKKVESEIADLTRQYDEVEENLRSTSPNYAALTQPKPLSTEEIQKQLLDKDTVLVEYSLGENRSYAFVVTPDSLTAHELPSQLKIEQAARRLHRLLKNEGNSSSSLTVPSKPNTASKAAQAQAIQLQTRRTAASLSRMVLDPIAGEIGNKRLLIVADGALHYIPFTALPEPVAAHSASSSRPPLMVNHEVILLPSASVLAVLRKQQERKAASTAEVAVLADPVFDKTDSRVLEARQQSPHSGAPAKTAVAPIESAKSMYDLATPPLTRSLVDVGLGRGAAYHLPRLRYTRREAEAIYAEVPPGSAMKALDFDANRATATSPELSRYRIVHFATHGLLNSEHPELSGLVLSLVDRDGRPQDGFLGLQDIYNLNLPADLVVLSACETGLGKEISGEGLVGLTRGFMYAGASRVVASLWKVSDAATARLMAEFYRSMERDHLAPAAALRQAQISMWKQKRWNDPYYWAAFQIQGEWK